MNNKKILISPGEAKKIRDIISNTPDEDLLAILSVEGIVNVYKYYGGTVRGDPIVNERVQFEMGKLLLLISTDMWGSVLKDYKIVKR